MRPSRWGEWRRPDVAVAVADAPGRKDAYELLSDVPDPGQPEPITAHISAEGHRPILMPLFPVGYFTPGSGCPHYYGPIRDGSLLCCMVCHDTGMRHHAAFKETARGAVRVRNWKPPEGGDQWSEDDVAPEAETAEPTRYHGRPKVQTREQKRDIRFGRAPRPD